MEEQSEAGSEQPSPPCRAHLFPSPVVGVIFSSWNVHPGLGKSYQVYVFIRANPTPQNTPLAPKAHF